MPEEQQQTVLEIETSSRLENEPLINDDADSDDLGLPDKYEITSFGADYDVEGMVRRIRKDTIIIPDFQREYVWSQSEASRFIESLLLGLPVPGVFLAKENETGKFIVIDGQQRLKSLQFFYDGYFNPSAGSSRRIVFALQKVQPKYEGLTYEDLDEKDRINLDNSIIHATIVKQDFPDDNDTSIYHIFERLNNGGQRLTAQEIRSAIYHGDLLDLIKELNLDENWRKVFGSQKNNKRLKDQELILRFLALYFNAENYERPMKDFLNIFAKRHVNATDEFIKTCKSVFLTTIEVIASAIERPFRPERALNAAVFDSVMVGLAFRLALREDWEEAKIRAVYDDLLKNGEYLELVSRSTSDEKNVERRIELSKDYFSHV